MFAHFVVFFTWPFCDNKGIVEDSCLLKLQLNWKVCHFFYANIKYINNFIPLILRVYICLIRKKHKRQRIEVVLCCVCCLCSSGAHVFSRCPTLHNKEFFEQSLHISPQEPKPNQTKHHHNCNLHLCSSCAQMARLSLEHVGLTS